LTFMGVSPSKSKSNPGTGLSGPISFHKILYCGSLFVALLAYVAGSAVVVSAQEERPEITPGERKPSKKKDAGPRAVGVIQLAANGKAMLVPIAILIGGKFWDATAYKATPVPMALESGTVYEAERAGSSLGLFTVNSALHSNSVNVQSPWIGTGAWVPAGAEKPKTALQAEIVPVGIDTSEGPPRLTRSPTATQETPAANTPPSSAPPQSSPGGATSPGQTSPSQTGSNPTSSSPPAPKSSTPPGPGENKPADSKSGDSKPSEAKPTDTKSGEVKPWDRKSAEVKPDKPSTPQSDSGASESNRPRLRRGKPVEPLPEDEVPGYSKPGAVGSASTGGASKVPETTADKGPVQLIPAISDASAAPLKSFAFDWLKDEEGERLQQMTMLARNQIRAYVDAQAKSKIAPKPAKAQAARRPLPSKTPDPILENVQMKAFDLWNSNKPVLVFTADAHMPAPPAGTAHAGVDSDLQYSILLVADPDIYNNLHKLNVAITDKYHLDIRPRLELVDAVDADGDGRGELLFHEASDAANGWVIYRATPDKLWKLFDSLNPE